MGPFFLIKRCMFYLRSQHMRVCSRGGQNMACVLYLDCQPPTGAQGGKAVPHASLLCCSQGQARLHNVQTTLFLYLQISPPASGFMLLLWLHRFDTMAAGSLSHIGQSMMQHDKELSHLPWWATATAALLVCASHRGGEATPNLPSVIQWQLAHCGSLARCAALCPILCRCSCQQLQCQECTVSQAEKDRGDSQAHGGSPRARGRGQNGEEEK